MTGVRALADPVRLEMIRILRHEPSSGSMLARTLSIPANRAHYHLKRLLDAGLIRALDGASKKRTEERLYAATARHILVDPGLGGMDEPSARSLRESIDSTFLEWRRSQILAIDWADLARLVVHRSLRVRRDDCVLLLFAPATLELAEAILIEVESCGARAHVRPWSRNIVLRSLDRYSSEELKTLPLVPEGIDAQLTAAVMLTSSLVQGSPPTPLQMERLPSFLESVSRWKRTVRPRGLRYVHVGLPHRAEFGRDFLTPEDGIDAYWRCVTADLDRIRQSGQHLLRIVQEDPKLVIRGARGTDLRVTVDRTHTEVFDGVISDEDVRGHHTIEEMPAGTLGTLPVSGSGDGVFAADYTFCSGQHIPRVRVTLRKGRIVEVEAAKNARVIRERLAREAGDPDVLSGLTIGLNPGAIGPTGRPELDSVLSGSVTLHFGNNELWGGNVKSTFNLSLPAHALTVRTRSRTLVTEGRLTVEDDGNEHASKETTR